LAETSLRTSNNPRKPLGFDLEDLDRRINMLENTLFAGLSYGVPVSITERGTASGQRVDNMRGAWVHATITALGNNTFTHNLELAAPTGVLNVRWLVFGWQHDGNGAGTSSNVALIYQGGTVTADAVDLYVTAVTRTVDVTHPLTLDLFFIPADG